jgi:hypothetical protein
MTQVCHRLVIAFLGPGIRPPRFRFVIDSPFWGQVFGRHGSGLSSTRLFGGHVFGRHGSGLSSTRFFGAKFSAAKTQVCRRLVIAFGSNRPPTPHFKINGLATNLKSFLLMKKATCQKIKYMAVRATGYTQMFSHLRRDCKYHPCLMEPP